MGIGRWMRSVSPSVKRSLLTVSSSCSSNRARTPPFAFILAIIALSCSVLAFAPLITAGSVARMAYSFRGLSNAESALFLNRTSPFT